jgi:hypothetical protein
MPSITVRDVPDDVHEDLVALAEADGLRLSQFLRAEMQRVAQRRRVEETLARPSLDSMRCPGPGPRWPTS